MCTFSEAGVPLHDGLCGQGARQGRGLSAEQEPAAQADLETHFITQHFTSFIENPIQK